ncbi:hypothetical protein ANCCAN_05250, partial [Ancylostoma caninum]
LHEVFAEKTKNLTDRVKDSSFKSIQTIFFFYSTTLQLSNKDFNLWPKNVDPKSGEPCVSMYRHLDKQKIYWETHPCNKGLPYVCQIAPCDSTNYCSEPLSAHRQMHRMYMHP